VRTSEQGGTRGYDGAKKVCGRKRHLLVDTLGLVLMVVITAANVQDLDGARNSIERADNPLPSVTR
jgi:putative transposase